MPLSDDHLLEMYKNVAETRADVKHIRGAVSDHGKRIGRMENRQSFIMGVYAATSALFGAMGAAVLHWIRGDS